MPKSAGHTHSSGVVLTHATHASSGGVGRGVGFSWRRSRGLPRVGPRRTAAVDEGVRSAVVQGTRDREEQAVHPEGQSIDRIVELARSVGLLIAMFGCVIALTVIADRPLAQVPVLGAGAQMLSEPSTRTRSSAVTHPAGTWTGPGRSSLSVAIRDHGQLQDRFSARQAATVTPVGVDRSRDRRADLMDMAISVRWHRGAASDLPPGSN